jgi:hypothetical protein
MSATDIIAKLDQLIPILATLAGRPDIADLANKLIAIANGQLETAAANTGKPTEQILQEASAKWDQALQNAIDLRNMT